MALSQGALKNNNTLGLKLFQHNKEDISPFGTTHLSWEDGCPLFKTNVCERGQEREELTYASLARGSLPGKGIRQIAWR